MERIASVVVGLLFGGFMSAIVFAAPGPSTPVPSAPWSQLGSGEMLMNFGFGLKQSTVANLPTCTAAIKGLILAASDVSSAPAYLANVTTGGGAVLVPVQCDGAGNWKAV